MTETIESVSKELDEWRRKKPRGEKMPKALIAKIVGLTAQHTRVEIRRRLHLKNSFLSVHAPRSGRPRGKSTPAPNSAFVRIDDVSPSRSPTVRFEVELPNGLKVRFF